MSNLSRRMFLRGVGGAALAIPLLPSLLSREAEAQVRTRRNPYFVSFLSAHGGVFASNMYPPDATLTDSAMAANGHHAVRRGRLRASVSNGVASLSPVLSAPSNVLTPSVVSKMNVLRGLDITYDIAHHNNGASLGNMAHNSSNPDPYTGGPRRSIDQVMAWSSAVYPDPSAVRVRSVVCTQNTPISWSYSNPVARTGSIDSVNNFVSSVSLFEELFPNPTASMPAPMRRTLVDAVRESYTRLRNGNRRLSAADRLRLDAHLARIDELERRLGATVVSCTTAPPRPANNWPLRDTFDTRPDQQVQYFKLFNDVLVAGLACGATKVANIVADGGYSIFSTWPVGGWHDQIAHEVNLPGMQQDLMVDAQRRFFAEVVLDLAARLDAIPEADGSTALDRALIVWLQEHSNIIHGNFSIPAVTIGSADRYFATNNYCDYRNRSRIFATYVAGAERAAPGLPYQQFWANCLQAMGVPHSEWAEPDHPGYSARFVHGDEFEPSDYPASLWATTGDTLPFLSST